MAERFTVGTVTGWPISPSTLDHGRNSRSKPATIAYVHDSAFCYRIVARFDSRGRFGNGNRQTPIEAAVQFAAELNEEHAQ